MTNIRMPGKSGKAQMRQECLACTEGFHGDGTHFRGFVLFCLISGFRLYAERLRLLRGLAS